MTPRSVTAKSKMAYIVQSRHMRNVVLSAILCAALAPGNVGAATLRMVVQSHPSLRRQMY